MFTEKLPAWREKQRAKMALFQGKIQVEKSGGNLAHIRCVTPTTTPPTAQHNISHKQAISLQLQCFHVAWAHFEKKVATLGEDSGERGGEPRGARWGTPGSTVGSNVEQPQGAGWGTPGSKVGSTVEERRAVHATARRERGKPTHKALRQHRDNSSPPHSLLTHVTLVRHPTNDTTKHRTIHTWLCPLMHIRAISGIWVGGFA